MQFSQLLMATLMAVPAALAAPAPAPEAGVSMMATGSTWTIENMKRTCNAADTSCTWTFGISTGSGTATSCKMVVKATDASEAAGAATCGVFSVTSGWSGQFGAGNGFTTLSVVDNNTRQIVWPAYTDVQLDTGKVVKPDQSYTPSNLP